MTLKSDAKFEEKLACGFKYDTRNLVNFQKPKNFTLMGYLLSKVYEVGAKTKQRSYLHDTEQWCKIWINPDLVVSKLSWGIVWPFIWAPKSLKNCTLMGSFCPKHIMFQQENFRETMCHNTERCCKI